MDEITKTATWKGYQESRSGKRSRATVDQLLDWYNKLEQEQKKDPDPVQKLYYELEKKATHRIMYLMTFENG